MPPSDNVVELTDDRAAAGQCGRPRRRSSVHQRRETLHAGDVLTIGLAVHNGPTNVPLDLYVGLFLPDGQIAFFSSPGLGGLRLPPVPAAPMQHIVAGVQPHAPALPRGRAAPGVPPGTYQFFAALVTPDALSDGVVTASDLAAFDLEQFTIAP